MSSDPNPIEICVAGARGRMGSLLLELIQEKENLELSGAIDRNGVGEKVGDGVAVSSPHDAEDVFESSDVVVEFTSPEGTDRFVEAALSTSTPYVTGTTGLTEETESKIKSAGEEIPVVWSSNFATGVNVFWRIVEEAASYLPEYDFEVTETHHGHKKDAPSGTAITTVERIQKAIGSRETVYGRKGESPRDDEIGVHARRGGEIVGEHEVLAAGEGESIEITHRAGDRTAFASGALDSATYAVDQDPGIYGMGDVLGLEE